MAEPRSKEITRNMFRPAEVQSAEKEEVSGEAISYGRDALRRLVRNKAALVGSIIILFIIVMAIVGPHMNKWNVDDQDLIRHNLPPRISALSNIHWLPFDGVSTNDVDLYEERDVGNNFWFGTDKLGRDLWTIG